MEKYTLKNFVRKMVKKSADDVFNLSFYDLPDEI